MRSVIVALALLLAPASHAGTFYPADITPAPVLAVGTIKLTAAYNRSAFAVKNDSSTGFIGFTATGALDTGALDGFLGTSIGKVTIWYDQIGSANFTCDGSAITSPYCPSIWDQPLANSRALVFDGENGGASGTFSGMVSGDISGLGCTAKDYAVIAVVQPSSSLFVNQASAPATSSGALFNLYNDPSGSVAQLHNSGNAGAPGWQATDDGSSFSYIASSGGFVQVNPIVVTIISDSTGVRIYQNERVWSTASRSGLTRTAEVAYLGQIFNSAEGGSNTAWGGGVAAWMLYCATLPDQTQLSAIRSALYSRYAIDASVSTYRARQVVGYGDSIMAGYHPSSGLYGYLSILETEMSVAARFLNYGDPGSTITVNPDSVLLYASTMQLATLTCAVHGEQYATLGRVAIVHGGGNDATLGPTGRTGTLTSGSAVIAVADTSNLGVGDYVYAYEVVGDVVTSRLSALGTIASIVSNVSITLTGATATVNGDYPLAFTDATVTPAVVRAGIQTVVDTLTGCGATEVIVSTVLKRNVPYQAWIDALNTQILANVTGATLADCANYSTLVTNPGANYSDSVHLSGLLPDDGGGANVMAACLLPYVEAALQ